MQENYIFLMIYYQILNLLFCKRYLIRKHQFSHARLSCQFSGGRGAVAGNGGLAVVRRGARHHAVSSESKSTRNDKLTLVFKKSNIFLLFDFFLLGYLFSATYGCMRTAASKLLSQKECTLFAVMKVNQSLFIFPLWSNGRDCRFSS